MEMVELLQKLIKAERTGNWPMKLETTRDMIEYFAAAGLYAYTKSLLLHLQQMTKLEIKHPEVYHHFLNGYHSIWRSEREWAGLSPDYVIESILMRSLKTSGGLTRGRGMSEQQRAIWTLPGLFLVIFLAEPTGLSPHNFTEPDGKTASPAKKQ